MVGSITKLIINSPYDEPAQYWHYQRENRDFDLKTGRRAAGYVTATPNAQGFDDPGIFVEIERVNKIRSRVKAWREADYPGVTGITKRLLAHWQDPETLQERRFFFCQLEAIETLIWLTEAPAAGTGPASKFRAMAEPMNAGVARWRLAQVKLLSWR